MNNRDCIINYVGDIWVVTCRQYNEKRIRNTEKFTTKSIKISDYNQIGHIVNNWIINGIMETRVL